METIVYLMRHAQTLPSPAQDNEGWRLSAQGMNQASAIVPYLKTLGVDVIYSSPLERAVQSVSIFSTATSIPVHQEEGLIEHEIAKKYLPPALFKSETEAYWNNFDYAQEGCETAHECQARMMNTLEDIVAKNQGKKILVCSHLQPVAFVLNHFDPTFSLREWEKVRMPEIFKLIYSENGSNWDKAFVSPDF